MLSAEAERSLREATTLLDARRPSEALAICERVMPRLMKQPDALHLYARALAENAQHDKAVRTIEKAIKLRPMDGDLRVAHAKALSVAGRFAECVQAAERRLAVEPRDTTALETLVQALTHQRDRSGAVEAVKRAIESGAPQDGRFAYALAEAARGSDDPIVNETHAIEVAERALALDETSGTIRAGLGFRLGALLERAERFDDAFKAFADANEHIDATFDHDAHRRATDALIEGWAADDFQPIAGAAEDGVVFIVGMPRSGTTLVEQILAANPDVATAGESTLLPEASAVLGVARPPYGYAPQPRGAARAKLAETSHEFVRRLRLAAGARSESVVLDKMPINAMLVPLAAAMLPNARFIGCLRDPRDVGLSCFQQFFTGSHPAMYRLESIAHFQADVLRAMHRWAELLPDRFTLVEYESVVGDLDGAARTLSDAACIAFSERSLRYWESGGPINTASYAQASRPVYTSSIGRWKSYEKHLTPLIDTLAARGVAMR